MRLQLPLVLTCLFAFCTITVLAGPAPMPLTANLDLAKTVVVGEITNIIDDSGPIVSFGSAVITVTKTLKGTPGKTVSIPCVTHEEPDYAGAATLPVHVLGEKGIWVIGGGDNPQVLPESKLPDVQAAIKLLTERKWSEPENGLRAWAEVVPNTYDPDKHSIIFAVQNVSQQNLYVPVENTTGFLTATTRAGTTSHTYVLSRFTDTRPPYCTN